MLRVAEDSELHVFDRVIRFVHWLTQFLVAIIFVLAFSIHFASSNADAIALTQLHRSFGVTVWMVTLGRLVWRQFSHFPQPARRHGVCDATRGPMQLISRSTPSC
jgi:cytochrome b561